MRPIVRKVITLLFIWQFTFLLYGQDCNTLDSLKNFHGIKFGTQLDKNIKAIANRIDNDYYLEYDSLSREQKTKYENLFRFYFNHFEEICIGLDKSNNIYSINIWSKLDIIDSADINRGRLPHKLSSLINRSIELFGKVTKTEKEDIPMINTMLGITQNWIWECKNIRLKIKYRVGAERKELNTIEVELTDINLEKRDVIESFKN